MTEISSPANTASPGIPADSDLTVTSLVAGLIDDLNQLRAEVSQLQEALRTRAPIDQAKGILMLRFSIDDDVAFRILVRLSSVTNLKLNVIAKLMVGLVNGDPGEPDETAPVGAARSLIEETLARQRDGAQVATGG